MSTFQIKHSNEEWRDVAGYEGRYRASSLGDVVGPQGISLSQSANSHGYAYVALYSGSKASRKAVAVHRLIADAFLPRNQSAPHVNHLDGNKLNNAASNLERCSPAQNTAHAYKLNLISAAVGERHGSAKLSMRQAASVLVSNESSYVLARRFGVSASAIQKIRNRKTWRANDDALEDMKRLAEQEASRVAG